MKKTVLLVAICAALCAMFASCSQLQTGNTATVSINSRQVVENARAAIPGFPSIPTGYAEITVKIAVVVNGEVRTKQFVFINDDNSSDKVYSFGNIPPSATVEVYCLCYHTTGNRPNYDMIGASGPIVVEAGTNDIKVPVVGSPLPNGFSDMPIEYQNVYLILDPGMIN